uniref:Glutathione S-transferase kappa n=1 Tax=Scylla olivacea TaxID=85551 RepID=A0A0P4WBE5_SCYOL
MAVSLGRAIKMKTKIELYYDVMSPFSWFAFEVLHRYKPHWNMDLHLKPVLLAGIIKTIGTTPEMLKSRNPHYHQEDIKRCAKYFNVPVELNDHEDILSAEVLASAGLAAGLTPKALAEVKEQMGQPVTKQRLKAYTDEAVEHGAFGVPTVVTHAGAKPELFFGSDRFHLIAREINETWMGPEPDTVHTKL